jgi:hypothetical protein
MITSNEAIYKNSFESSIGTLDFCFAKHHQDMEIKSNQYFTIECWFNPIRQSGCIFSKGISGDMFQGGGSDYYLDFKSGKIDFYSFSVSANTPLVSFSGIQTGKWYHSAIVKDEKSTRLYINGIESSSNANNSWISSGTGNFYIGTNFVSPESSANVFNGYIDNFKFTKIGKYKNDFDISKPINEYMAKDNVKFDKFFDKNVLYLEMDGFNGDKNIQDSSYKNFKLDNVRNVSITSNTSKFGGASAYFDGSSILRLGKFTQDSDFNKVSLLMHFDGAHGGITFTDSSVQNLQFNRFGTPTLSNQRSKFGATSIYFPGGGSRISCPSNPGFAFGTADFTIEFWVYRENTNIVRFMGNGSTGGWAIELGNATKWSTPSGEIISTAGPTVGNWVHVAFCRSNNIVRLFYNGILIASATDNNNYSQSDGTFYFGADNGGNFPFNGWVDELRITKGTARYPAQFIPPEEPFSDSSISTNLISDQIITESFDIVNVDFTIDFWIKSIRNADEVFVKHVHLGGNNAGGWRVGKSVSGYIYFACGLGASEFIFYSNTVIINRNWNKISVCKYNNVIYIFINGVLDSSANFISTNLTGNLFLTIGGDGILNNYLGYIDDLKITKGVAKYIPNFNTPNIGFLHNQKSDPHFKNVSLLLCSNNPNNSLLFLDESRFNVSRLGNGCANFNGTDTIITVPFSGVGNFGTGNFTMEAWVKPVSLPSAGSFIGLLNKASLFNSNNAWRFYLSGENGTPTFEYTENGNSANKSVQGPNVNNYEWNHLAIVRNSGILALYTNGVSGNSFNIGGNSIFNNNLNVQIGRFQQAGSSNIFNGFMEDVRITNNIGRYIDNFSGSLPAYFPDDSGNDIYYNNVDILLHMNGYHNLFFIEDSSKNKYVLSNSNVYVKLNNDILTNGSSIYNSSSKSVFGGASMRGIGGSTSYLSTQTRYDFGNFGTGDFTIEWWDFISGWNGEYFPVIHYGNDGDYALGQSRVGIYYSETGNKLNVSMLGNTQQFPLNSGNQTFQWKHNAVTRRNGYVNFFQNGAKNPSGYLMDYDITRGVNISTIGAGKYGASLGTLRTMNGFIDDLRVTKNISRYIDDFEPPKEQFSNF